MKKNSIIIILSVIIIILLFVTLSGRGETPQLSSDLTFQSDDFRLREDAVERSRTTTQPVVSTPTQTQTQPQTQVSVPTPTPAPTPTNTQATPSTPQTMFTSATVFTQFFHPEMNPSCAERGGLSPRTVTFPATQAVLTSSLQQLLLISENQLSEESNNFVSASRGFALSSVVIENNTAKIYFTNLNANPFTADCHEYWFKQQVAQTANQYPTVFGTEVYINGQKI